MLHLNQIEMQFGGRLLFGSVSMHIRKKDRAALIGANGTGKSTLLKIIHNDLIPTGGQVIHSRHLRIGYLPQEGLSASGQTLIEEATSAFRTLRRIEQRLAEIHDTLRETDPASEACADLIDEQGELMHQMELYDAFTVESKTALVLNGLGFRNDDFDRPCEEFSGGWQMRIALAKLLLQNPDLLLLDEPTNHLDIETIEWFENYLINYDGSVLMVSHDRVFINRICRRILELDHQTLTEYIGTYEEYEESKILNEEKLLAEYERQQDEIKRVRVFIDRFRYKATKARQVQSRVKMLEKMEHLQLPEDDPKSVNFRFPQPPASGRIVVEAEDVAKTYDRLQVFSSANMRLERGDKAALIGVNGAGKSTLVRLLSGIDAPTAGTVKWGHNVTVEYYAQQQAEKLNEANTVYDELASCAQGQTPLMLRTILGAFLFSGDDINKKVRVLSGGEKSRLAFAKMLLNPVNFIILDEPTNHIDVQTKEILQGALADYEGTLLIVSHDRSFLDNLVRKVYELKNGQLRLFLGNYSDYHEKKMSEAPFTGPEIIDDNLSSSKIHAKEQYRKTREEQKRHAAEQRRKERTIKSIEDRLEETEKRKTEFELQLADPELYKDTERSIAVQKEYKATMQLLEALYRDWEMASEE